jgi:hypothetical protein
MERQHTCGDRKLDIGRNNFLLRVMLCCLVLFTMGVRAAKFTASLDRETMILGESVKLKLEFEGVNPGGMPRLPTIPGLRVSGGLSSGTSSTIGPNGQTSVTWFSVPLAATQPGDFTIPAFQLELEGQKLASTPLQLKVLREDPINPPAELGEKSAFLWLSLPKSECYVGETFVAELRLYIRQGVRNIAGFQPPQLQGDGFTSGKQLMSQSRLQRRVGRQVYTVVPMLYAVTAVKTGPINVTPLNSSIVLNPPDPFDQFFGRGRDTEQVALTTEPRGVRALPLPTENVPSNFNGAVGSYSMNVSVGPTNVTAGDPITIKVQITGRGAIESLSLPTQAGWEKFKTYPPTSNVEISDELGVQGRKTFEQIVSAESAELKEIPPFTFSFFDPEAKQYRALTQPATPLTVKPGGIAPVPVIAGPRNQNTEPPVTAQDIVHIKTRMGSLSRIGPALIVRPWFIGANCLPVLAWFALVGWRKRTDALTNNPRLRRQRRVAQVVRAGLEELRQHAAANDSDKFFATLFHLLQEQLGERLDCAALAITEAAIDERLRPLGVEESTLAELHELFQMHNLARYAPVQTSEQLVAVIPQVEDVLSKLQEVNA